MERSRETRVAQWIDEGTLYAMEVTRPLWGTGGISTGTWNQIEKLLAHAWAAGAVQAWSDGWEASEIAQQEEREAQLEDQAALAYERAHGPGRI